MKPKKLWIPFLLSMWAAEAFEVISPEEAKKAWAHQAAIARTRGTKKDLNAVRQPRIVGGTNATTGRYPYFAYIELSNDENVFFCSGTLIWPDLILTAAHCIVDLINEGIVVSKVDAYVGLDDQTKFLDAEYREVDAAMPHPSL
jgi:secreted trypsin-like serine protease